MECKRNKKVSSVFWKIVLHFWKVSWKVSWDHQAYAIYFKLYLSHHFKKHKKSGFNKQDTLLWGQNFFFFLSTLLTHLREMIVHMGFYGHKCNYYPSMQAKQGRPSRSPQVLRMTSPFFWIQLALGSIYSWKRQEEEGKKSKRKPSKLAQ